MALTGDELEAASQHLVQLYREAEESIVEQVTRRLAAGMDATDWQAQRLAQLASLRRGVERILEVTADRAAGPLRDTIAAAWRTGTARATTTLPAALFPRDPDLVAAAGVRQIRAAALESLAAGLVRDVGQRHSNIVRHVEDVYRTVIARASASSIAGGITRREASQQAYRRFIDQGLTSFTDVSGRRWRLSSYVEMGVRTVTQRAAVQGQTDRLQDLGLDLVIVSDSPRECELCRPHEGRVYSISGDTPTGRVELPSAVDPDATVTVTVDGTLGKARADGLFHPNCTHSVSGYQPGVTRRPTGRTANPQGYQAKERQREIERQIRRWKERAAGALTDAAAAAARAKVRQWQGEMREHLRRNPELKRLPYRERPGAGNLPRGGTTAARGPITPDDLGPPPTGNTGLDLDPPRPAPTAPASVRRPANQDDPIEIGARMVAEADQVDQRQAAARATPWDEHLVRVGELQGFDGLPQVGSRADLDAAVEAGWLEVWRGVMGSKTKSAADINAELRTGAYRPGKGMYGNGYYTSTRRNTGETYRGRDPKTDFPANPNAVDFEEADFEGEILPDSLLRIAIDPNARIIDLEDLQQQMEAASLDAFHPAIRTVLSDPGRFAAAAGYDAIRIRELSDGALYPGWESTDDPDGVSAPQADQLVILNRTVMLIQRAEDEP